MDHHDHAAMGHDSPTPTATVIASGVVKNATAAAAAGGMGMGGKSKCKISMLFNLNTIDSCFLSDRWRITSPGMFAGSCIGVFLLGMVLELLRRSVKEYDRFIIRQHIASFRASSAAASPANAATPAAGGTRPDSDSTSSKNVGVRSAVPPFRPSLLQQAIRAFLHLLQFVCAYILMLLAMYYNGYLLLCIFLGAYFGAFVFQWENLPLGGEQTSAANEATVCCG